MNRSRRALAVAFLISFPLVTGAQPDTPDSTRVLKEACEQGWGAKPSTRFKDLQAALGKAKSIRTTVEPNPFTPGENLEWRHLEFSLGLHVSVVLVNQDPNRMFVSYAAITSPHRELPGGLHVGDASGEFALVLGSPNSEKPQELAWWCNAEGADFITAVVDAGRVTELRWFYYVD